MKTILKNKNILWNTNIKLNWGTTVNLFIPKYIVPKEYCYVWMGKGFTLKTIEFYTYDYPNLIMFPNSISGGGCIKITI